MPNEESDDFKGKFVVDKDFFAGRELFAGKKPAGSAGAKTPGERKPAEAMPTVRLTEQAFRRELGHVSQELGSRARLPGRSSTMTALHLRVMEHAHLALTHTEATTDELKALRNEYLARLSHFAMNTDMLLMKQ